MKNKPIVTWSEMYVSKAELFFIMVMGVLFSLHSSLHAQQVRISGTLTDGLSGERLIGANVFDKDNQKGTVTNAYGFFSLSVPRDAGIDLTFSYVGYGSETLSFRSSGDTAISIRLQPLELDAVTVTAERRIRPMSVNAVQFVSPDLLEYPSLKPEIDILDVIRQLPGVQPGLEGSVGFSVRGGNNDQNLILMDNIPLYNTGHLASFVSIFDPYAINSMTFYKGGFPAQYGGRIASVLDIYMKEGDMREYRGEANIGMLSGKIALEGPIIKDRTSFLLSFRRSTVDLFLSGIYTFIKPESRFMYAFHDLNFKINHKIDEKNHLYLSVYHGGDRLNTQGARSYMAGDTTLREYSSHYLNRWGNRSVSFRWNRILSNSVFYNATLAYSGFHYQLGSGDMTVDNGRTNTENEFNYGAAVNDLVMKHDWDIIFNNKSQLKTGLHLTGHHFEPVRWEQYRVEYGEPGRGNSSENFVSLRAWELFGYVQGDFSLWNDLLTVHPGVRVGRYALENSVGYNLVEPRLRVQLNPRPDINYQLDYTRMGQTVHSLNSSGTSLTADVWVPVTERLRPAISDQVSAMYNRSFPEKDFNLQAGVYYKEMRDLIDFNGNSGFATIRGEWDEVIAANGFGRAYGLELAADKTFDKFSLEGNYTFSRSVRKFDEINQGRYYPQNFDRPHNFTVSSVTRLNRKTSLSVLWTYHTGQPITLGVQAYSTINNHIYYQESMASAPGFLRNPNTQLYSPDIVHFETPFVVDDVNNFRMPDYHRLDLALNHTKIWENGWKRTFGISVYNAYNRQNAYFIYAERGQNQIKFHKLTLFPILPTVSYGIKF